MRDPIKRKARHLKWRTNNPEKVRANTQKWRKENPKKESAANAKYNLKKKYGLTLEDKIGMMNKQNNTCPSCLIDFSTLGSKNIHIDHNHTTKQIRGILCAFCNIALGYLKENPASMRRLADYIESFS